jgi:hypothetical protein
MPMPGAPKKTYAGAVAALLSSTKAAAAAGVTITSPAPDNNSYLNCRPSYSMEWNAEAIDAVQKGNLWASDICTKYPGSICLAYDRTLRCHGERILKWYNGSHPIMEPVQWLCEEGYESPLYPKYRPIHGICPRIVWPEGKPRPQLEAVMVQWNDHEPVFWPVSPVFCEMGHECTFQFFYPCEPLVLGKEPHIVGWNWKTEPGRIRPSGLASAQR